MTRNQFENVAFLFWGVLAILVVVLWSLSSHAGDSLDEAGWFVSGISMFTIGWLIGRRS